MKRVFVIVLDSCGIGEMPDAAAFGDAGCNTLKSAAKADNEREQTEAMYFTFAEA